MPTGTEWADRWAPTGSVTCLRPFGSGTLDPERAHPERAREQALRLRGNRSVGTIGTVPMPDTMRCRRRDVPFAALSARDEREKECTPLDRSAEWRPAI